MPKFTAIPAVPTSGLPQWKVSLYNALKQNVELLIDQRGEADKASKALISENFQPLPVSGSVLAGLTPPLTSVSNLAKATVMFCGTTTNVDVVGDANLSALVTSVSYRVSSSDVRALMLDVQILRERIYDLVSKLRS